MSLLLDAPGLAEALATLATREKVLEAYPPEPSLVRPGGAPWTRRRGANGPTVQVYLQAHKRRVLVTHTHREDLALALASLRHPEHAYTSITELWLRRHIGEHAPGGDPLFEEVRGELRMSFPALAVCW